ncbi:MAG: DUF6629 family protein [Tenuifilaceae bacterium]
MCFSAEASFVGGVIIASVGIATIRKVHKPSQILFASIPLFFGIQQITEGFVWISLPNPEYLIMQKLSTYIFLIMAVVIWPTMIPLSVLFMEKNKKRIKILRVLTILGALLSIYYSVCLILFDVNPQIMGYHIRYNSDFPKHIAIPVFITYLISTITPLFVSSVKRVHYLGVLMFLSCLVTAIFFTQYLTSVWCFFAAIISGVIYWILRDSKIQFNLEKLNFLKNPLKS